MDVDISTFVYSKFVDMNTDGEFHVHSNPGPTLLPLYRKKTADSLSNVV